MRKSRDADVLGRLSQFHPEETELWYDQYEKAYRGRERSASPKGHYFKLSKAQFWDMVYRAGGRCELTSQPFDRFYKAPTGKRPYIPTIDRINSTGHYTPDNCELLTWIANIAVPDFGREAFLDMVKYGSVSPALRKHLEEQERKAGDTGRYPGAFDNLFPFIRDSALGRWIARQLS